MVTPSPEQAERRYSVVIPAHNRQVLTEEAVASALAQTLLPLEVIVVDDGSDEPITLESHNSDTIPVRVLRTDENYGAAAARNAGAAAAAGTHVAFLDSDDLWLPGHLAAIDLRLAENPDAVAAYSLCRGESGWRKLVPYGALRLRRMHARRLGWPRPTWHTPATVVQRETFLNLGGFAEQLLCREDTDLWLRLLEQGKVATARKVTVVARRQDSGSSASAMRRLPGYREMYFAVLERQIERGLKSGRIPEPGAARMRREVHRYWAKMWLSRGRWREARQDLVLGYLTGVSKLEGHNYAQQTTARAL